MKPLLARTAWQAIGIIAAALLAAGLTKWLHPLSPTRYRVEDPRLAMFQKTIDELRDLYTPEQLLWIDSRPRKLFEKEHLDGAMPLTEENWADQAWDLREQLENLNGRAVVVYCDGKRCQRSLKVAERLRQEMGLEPVWILEGNWRKWQGAVPP